MRWILAAIPALVAGVVLIAAPGQVDGQDRHPVPQYGSWELQVVVGGVPKTEYQLGGQTYVEGQIGERYALRISNHDSRRVEVVLAVDGRDAIDGQPAHSGKRGYVLPPWGSAEIDGFRLSASEVAAFRFTTVPNSYAARTGTPWTVGQLSASFFPERFQPRTPTPPPIAKRPAAATESRAAPRDRNRSPGLGTEFGERRWSPVQETSFVRADPNNPTGRVSIRYTDRRGLCSLGLDYLCQVRPQPRPYLPPYQPYYDPYEPPRRYSTPPSGWENY